MFVERLSLVLKKITGLLLMLLMSWLNLASATEWDYMLTDPVNLVHEDVLIIDETDSGVFGTVENKLYSTDEGYLFKQYIITKFVKPEPITYVYDRVFYLDQDYAIIKGYELTSVNQHQSKVYFKTENCRPFPLLHIYDASDKSLIRSILLKAGPIHYSDTIAYKIIADNGLAANSSYEFTLLDTEELASYTAEIHIGEIQLHLWEDQLLELVPIHFPSETYIVDAQGKIYEVATLKASAKATTNPDLAAVNSLLLNAFNKTANVWIDRPQDSYFSLIEASGVRLDRYNLSDNRQKITEYVAHNQFERIMLRVKQDKTDYRYKAFLPIDLDEKPGLVTYLGTNNLIDPTPSEIQSLAKQIVADEDDVWQASLQILDYVSTFIKPQFLLKPLSTAEIISTHHGDLPEYVTFFAALARAAGIPTRIAGGLRYYNNSWCGWLWNEVWVGQWVAVDPFYRQTAPDALVIKLASGRCIADLDLSSQNCFRDLTIKIRQVDSLVDYDN